MKRMKRLLKTFILLVLISIPLNSSCAPEATPAPPTLVPAIPAPLVKPLWQEEWESTLTAAKKEGKVSIMSTLPAAVHGISGPFKQRYDIELEYFVATASELLSKVDIERRAGIYVRDVTMFGMAPALDSWAPFMESIEPHLILPEVKDPNVWRGNRLPFYDKEGKLVLYLSRVGPTLLVNKELVKPEELKSWRNLLEPKWKGKILINDPAIIGAGSALMATVGEIMGMDFLHKLAKQEPVMNRDKRLQVEWIAKGKYLIGFAFDTMIMEEMRAAGVPLLHIVPSEGTYVGSAVGNIAMFNRAANPKAAKIFINWFLSKEGQTILVNVAREQSRRIDVEPALLPDRIIQEGIQYVEYDTKEFQKKFREMYEGQAKEIFAAQYK